MADDLKDDKKNRIPYTNNDTLKVLVILSVDLFEENNRKPLNLGDNDNHITLLVNAAKKAYTSLVNTQLNKPYSSLDPKSINSDYIITEEQ